MTRITVGNVWSQLTASKEILRVVRHGVAYQDVVMPPVDAQRAIKSFFRQRRRFGAHSDMMRLWADTPTCEALFNEGVTPTTLTVAQFEQVLRQRGVWDGWVRMVQADGKFPTGLLRHVERQLTLRAQTSFEVDDNRGSPPQGSELSPRIPLYDFQESARQSAISAGRGVIDLPPRSGKTRIAIAIVASLGVPTLYVTPGIGLVKQTVAAFNEFFPGLAAGQSGAPNAKERRALLRALVWVTTPQTAVKLPNIHARQLLIMDEFHHAAATTWQAVSEQAVGAWWRFGLTGTHFRADGKDMEMAAVLGRSVFKRSVSEMVELERLVPAHIAMLRCLGPPADADNKTCYKIGVVEHEHRNAIVAYAASELQRRGFRVLVLVKQIGHGEELARLIPRSVQVDGRDNEAVDQRLAQLARGEIGVVIGTSVIGEGRDVPAADALVYAAGGKSRVKVKQDYFRVLTASPGKKVGIIVDVADLHHGKLFEHSVHRMMLYREEDCFESAVMNVESFDTFLSATIGESPKPPHTSG